MRACTDRGQCACVQPLNRLCVSARAAKSSWTHKVCVLSVRLCAQLRVKGQACARIYAPHCVLRGREASLWRVRASHRNPYSFSFFFLCLSLLNEQYVIAVEKNRPMNFSEAFIVMHGHSRRGYSINYRLFYCVILVIDINYIRNYWNILCSHFVKYTLLYKKYFINISIHKELKRLFVEMFIKVFQVCNSFWKILNERFKFNNLNRALNYFNKIIFNDD